MSNKFSAYRSIDNFKNFISGFKRHFRYKGKDGDGLPIYDPDMILPKILVTGTEKIHGTNAGIGYNLFTGEIHFQSRNNVIAVGNDNAGFAAWAETKHDIFQGYFKFICDFAKEEIEKFRSTHLYIYGEWAGGNIQGDKSACSKHEKVFIVFDVKLRNASASEGEPEECYLDIKSIMEDLSDPDEGIYPVSEHRKWVKELDFNDPEPFLLSVEEDLLALEKNSIFGEVVLGIPNNVGEGFVYKFVHNFTEHVFKIKGGEHAARATKIPKMSLTPAELESRKGMAFQVTPEWRLSQMFDQVFVDEAPTMRKTGDFIKAVMQDIIKEESNVIADAGYTMKDINADVVMYVKHYLTNRIREAMNE
jgi:hypothetical protein